MHSLSLGYTLQTTKVPTRLTEFSATLGVRYCVLKPIVPYAEVLVRPSERYIEQKQTK